MAANQDLKTFDRLDETAVISALLAWCDEIPGLEHIDPDEALFARLADSWPVVELFPKIAAEFDCDLELAVLSEVASVRDLAREILKARLGGKQREWCCLVPINPAGSRLPIFAIHAVEGTVHIYDELAASLGPDQPFFALQSPLLFRNNVYETSIEELSSAYVRELHRAFPSGPYILIGASFGGHVAFEMARKLHDEGMEPALLLLIDSVVPGSAERVEVQERAASIWRNIQGEGFSYLSRKIRVKMGHLQEKTLWRIRMAICSVYRRAGRRLPSKLRFFRVEVAQRAAVMCHAFMPYQGKITVVRATFRDDILRKRDDPALGWKPLAQGEFELHHFPVNHISMLREPAVHSFADLLRRLLPKEVCETSSRSQSRARAE